MLRVGYIHIQHLYYSMYIHRYTLHMCYINYDLKCIALLTRHATCYIYICKTTHAIYIYIYKTQYKS